MKKQKQYRPQPNTPLTPRELQAIRLVCSGLKMQKAATLLGIAHKTLHTYVERASRRLGAKSLCHLGVLADRAGILEKNTSELGEHRPDSSRLQVSA